jgi:hypothetical protein
VGTAVSKHQKIRFSGGLLSVQIPVDGVSKTVAVNDPVVLSREKYRLTFQTGSDQVTALEPNEAECFVTIPLGNVITTEEFCSSSTNSQVPTVGIGQERYFGAAIAGPAIRAAAAAASKWRMG